MSSTADLTQSLGTVLISSNSISVCSSTSGIARDPHQHIRSYRKQFLSRWLLFAPLIWCKLLKRNLNTKQNTTEMILIKTWSKPVQNVLTHSPLSSCAGRVLKTTKHFWKWCSICNNETFSPDSETQLDGAISCASFEVAKGLKAVSIKADKWLSVPLPPLG